MDRCPHQEERRELSLAFTPWGFYREWRTVFHLPGDLRLRSINSSKGMNYMIFASNESLLVEARVYHVRNPAIAIEYQQPLNGEPREDMALKENSRSPGSRDITMIVAFISILAVVSVFAFVARKRREKSLPGETDLTDLQVADCLPLPESRPQDTEDGNGEGAGLVGMNPVEEDQMKVIRVSSEMASVMKTLTSHERSILEMLIRHGGRMTQMEMR